MFCFRLQSKHTDVTKSDRAKKKKYLQVFQIIASMVLRKRKHGT